MGTQNDKTIACRIMEETKNSEEKTPNTYKVIQTASSVNNENLMRLISPNLSFLRAWCIYCHINCLSHGILRILFPEERLHSLARKAMACGGPAWGYSGLLSKGKEDSLDLKASAVRAGSSHVVIREKEDNCSWRHGSDVKTWVGFATSVPCSWLEMAREASAWEVVDHRQGGKSADLVHRLCLC